MELEEMKKLTAQGEREYSEEVDKTLESTMIKRIEAKLRNLDWQENEIKEGLKIIRKRVLLNDSQM